MRLLVPPLALATTLIIPAVAHASPFAVPLRANNLDYSNLGAPETSAPTMGGEAAPADAPAEAAPVDEAAPADEAPTEGPAAIADPTAEGEGEAEEDEELEDELSGPTKKGDFNANAIGLRGGIHLVPSYFLNAALASYSNSLCRDKPGKWGEENGLVYVDGCNFYVGGDYIRRISRAFDISFGVGYLHIKPPDSLWIDNDEWDRDNCDVDEGGLSNCNLGAADYTSIDLRMFTMELNFIGRGTLYKNADVEIQMGGGGGVGVGILIGKGISRTPLGESPSGFNNGMVTPDSCQTLADTADFRKCTPHYYDEPDIDQDNDGSPVDISRDEVDANGGMAPQGTTSTGNGFARCSEHKCDGGDLATFGTTETGGTWPAYPLVNILGDFRIVIKDSFGISIQGGIKTGFFFGGGIQYYFGGGGKDNDEYKKKHTK
jgi:hypothetical protein